MKVEKIPVIAVSFAVIVLIAGCATSPSSPQAGATSSESPTVSTGTTPSTPITEQQTTYGPSWNSQLVIEELPNTSDPQDVPHSHFQNLSSGRQNEFLQAFNSSWTLNNPKYWEQDTKYSAVKYNGSWYRIYVKIR